MSLYYKFNDRSREIQDFLDQRDEWEVELEKGQNRGPRRKLDLDFDEEEDYEASFEGCDQEWDEDDIGSLDTDSDDDLDTDYWDDE